MSTGASDWMLRCVFDGCLSMSDTDIERRPYHRDCKCALHKEKGKCSHSGSQQSNVAFPKTDFVRKCSYSISHSVISSQTSCVQNSSSRSRECINENVVSVGHNKTKSVASDPVFGYATQYSVNRHI